MPDTVLSISKVSDKATRIVRFVPYTDATIDILCEDSVFTLKSIKYYRTRETKDADEHEGSLKFSDRCLELLNETLISCWAVLDQHHPLDSYWEVFKGREVALISTVGNVQQLLESKLEWLLVQGSQLSHGSVQYFESNQPYPVELRNDVARIPYWKEKNFERENEYRFSLVLVSSDHQNLPVVGFHVEAKGYICDVRLSPQVNKRNERRDKLEGLLRGAISADVNRASLIADIEDGKNRRRGDEPENF